jgi:hypothetical protein
MLPQFSTFNHMLFKPKQTILSQISNRKCHLIGIIGIKSKRSNMELPLDILREIANILPLQYALQRFVNNISDSLSSLTGPHGRFSRLQNRVLVSKLEILTIFHHEYFCNSIKIMFFMVCTQSFAMERFPPRFRWLLLKFNAFLPALCRLSLVNKFWYNEAWECQIALPTPVTKHALVDRTSSYILASNIPYFHNLKRVQFWEIFPVLYVPLLKTHGAQLTDIEMTTAEELQLDPLAVPSHNRVYRGTKEPIMNNPVMIPMFSSLRCLRLNFPRLQNRFTVNSLARILAKTPILEELNISQLAVPPGKPKTFFQAIPTLG